MKAPISIKSFLTAIQALPADRAVINPKKWYRTQKEHWIGWLSEYEGPGAYGRQTVIQRDARFAYNHIVEPRMLLYLANAAGIDRKLLATGKQSFAKGATLMGKSRMIRSVIPWETVAAALWAGYSPCQKRQRGS